MAYTPISELHPNILNPRVVGIIITKTDVKSFPDQRNAGVDRCTFGFTIKDSPDFFINVTAWGNDNYIKELSNSVRIGDCVTIENPLVSSKDPEKGDKFCPTTPSVYRLMVTEFHSQVNLCADVGTVDNLAPLIHLPVKDFRDFHSLEDILANRQSLDGTVINILAAVKSIGEQKHFTTSDGRRGQKLEVKLFDDSVSSFPLVCWDREAIQLMQTLIPKETVLFIADARISFDSFHNGMTATVTCKTIITVNPDTKEASLLFSYAQEMSESGALDQDEKPDEMSLDSITDVYTVNQLKEKTQEAFFGITYSFISKLEIGSSVSKVIRARCSWCKFLVNNDMQCCNELCQGRDETFQPTWGFDLLVDLTDHTGTLRSCNLWSPVAERTLGCSTDEFTRLTDDQRIRMKWKFLLQRCKIFVKILPSARARSGIRATILGISLADPGEVKMHMSALLKRV